MAQAREIKTKIGTVKSTQKITRAMEMVAASKLHKAQQRMMTSRPYAEKIATVTRHIATSSAEYPHPLLAVRPAKKIGYIIISSDRGLCGGLNTNLFKRVLLDMQQQDSQSISLCLIGAKAEQFFKRNGGNILAQVIDIGHQPTVADLIGTVKVMFDAYRDQEIDMIKICFNRFVSTMIQQPVVRPLLPLQQQVGTGDVAEAVDPATTVKQQASHWDYIYEPDAKPLLELVLQRYIESEVYQAVMENIACKQAAQMIAMKNATENAGKIIDDLKLEYNKARQSAITQELAEIVAGAETLGT